MLGRAAVQTRVQSLSLRSLQKIFTAPPVTHTHTLSPTGPCVGNMQPTRDLPRTYVVVLHAVSIVSTTVRTPR
jgi:hypothetical protein